MKRFITIFLTVLCLFLLLDYGYYHRGIHIAPPSKEITAFIHTKADRIELDTGSGFQPFEIKGVNMGSGLPGHWATDFFIDKRTYLRWFQQIQDMGANTLRVYTIQSEAFYSAFYEYNLKNPTPLYLLQGVWVNDYVQNSHVDAYDSKFFDAFLESCQTAVDVIHGQRKILPGAVNSAGSGHYRYDISPWVIGYILGVEWKDTTVAFTDAQFSGSGAPYEHYQGTYLCTTSDASPFESMLAQVGDQVISYESNRYHTQRLVAFANGPTTDPFFYPETITEFLHKCSQIDTEHILSTDRFISGQFASYHIYPYYPDYLLHAEDWTDFGIGSPGDFLTEDGAVNTYLAYLTMLTNHHEMPVVISEFGTSTGRGMAHEDVNTERNQGYMSEFRQGQAIIDCYRDIRQAGAAGGCIFAWQDEWFKRSWNTMYAVNMLRTPYWSDYQTNDQYFGLLSFDPGEEETVCILDGNDGEWSPEDLVLECSLGQISVRYDSRFLYFLIEGEGLTDQPLYLPLDITPKTGSYFCDNFKLRFDRPADFLIVINGRERSRIMVQERYEALRANYAQELAGFDTYAQGNVPDADSPLFKPIFMLLNIDRMGSVSYYETGKLRWGNGDPKAPDYDSLADLAPGDGCIELRLPWQLLNFGDPSRMSIHDDYYSGNYGIRFMDIDTLYVGLMREGTARGTLAPVALKGWDEHPAYHERLKPSYYMVQEFWRDDIP